jgi:hypothetical protein
MSFSSFPFPNFSNDVKLSMEPHEKNDNRISFDEPSHKYFLDGTHQFSLSTTPFVHAPFEEFDPEQALRAIKNSAKWKQGIHEHQAKTDEEIKAVWANSSVLGTIFHARCENYYLKGEIPDYSTLQEFEKKEMDQFLRFNQEHVIPKGYIPYRTEWRVYDEEIDIAGSVDMIYMNPKTGKLLIYDWKRTKDLPKTAFRDKKGIWPMQHLPDSKYWAYSLQLNMYRYMLEKNYGVEIEGLCLVACHCDRSDYLAEPVAFMDDEIQSLVRVRKELLKRGIKTFHHEDLLLVK